MAQRKTLRSRRSGKQIRRPRDDAQLTREKLSERMNADQAQQRLPLSLSPSSQRREARAVARSTWNLARGRRLVEPRWGTAVG